MSGSVKPFRLSRRALLRGAAGTALALPWLEAMIPRAARAAVGDPAPRVLFLYFPTGYRVGSWVTRPAGVYPDLQFPAITAALAPLKDHLTFVTGASNVPATVGNGGDGIHARGTGCFLTCEVLTTAGFKTGVSADQLIARAVGKNSCVPSLALGVPSERLPGFAEDGYGAVYYNNISYSGPTSNLQKDSNPRTLFNRLITCSSLQGQPGTPVDPKVVERGRFELKVMDSVKDEANKLRSCVGQEDRLRLDEYFNSISELQQRFDSKPMDPTAPAQTCMKPGEPPAVGVDYADSTHLMMDVALFAFRCGLTQVATMMMDGAFSRRDYGLPDINNVDYVHGLSHGEISGKAADFPRWEKITTSFFNSFAYLLNKMAAINEGQRSLLQNTLVYINSEFGDGDAHSQDNLPVILAGNLGGKFKSGQHVALPARTPVANVLLTILQSMGLTQTAFGNSTGTASALLV